MQEKPKETKSSPIWRLPWFERVYNIGIAIKGIDGAVELIAGLAIWLSPHLVHRVLTAVSSELGEHTSRPFQWAAGYLGQIDGDVLKGGLIFVILFLVIHGVVKLALVYALLKRIERAYPAALLVLVVFLAVQLYSLIVHPSIGMAILTVLDAAIIWLVWNEYQELKARNRKMV